MKVLGPPVSYIDLLDEATEAAIKEEQAAGTSKGFFPLRPSSSGDCTRQLFYALMEYEGKAKYPNKEGMKAPTKRLLDLGNSVEYHVIQHLNKYLTKYFKIKYKQQMLEFYPLERADGQKLLIEGSLDLCLISDEHRGVFDVKSKKDKFNAAYKTDWDAMFGKLEAMATVHKFGPQGFWVEDLEAFLLELNDPFLASNFKQLNGYACSEFLVKRGIDHAALFQYNKNDSRMRELRFKPSEAVNQQIKKKFQTVLTATESSNPELAPKDFLLGSIKCAFCPFKTECWDKDDALKAFFNQLPRKNWPTDTAKLANGQELEEAFALYEQHAQVTKSGEILEGQILKALVDQKVNKVRLSTGAIYDVKQLKDRFVLRKGKI